MTIVKKSQVALYDGKLVGEASTMGLGIGEWPDFIAVVDDLNEGLLFSRGPAIIYRFGPGLAGPGQFGGYTYSTKDGRVGMDVFND